ncbi:uncharacterized protein LOC108674423 [Hyalella azteca]|uniref:Uncharacterized protein LOC108674423 n=1 Tax=Hyalella azteca TaxID=294128 RepID=A0A8B7NVS6_HYAAZ|nr:uncharacterized protein LOC108674423 [Hyalella azteca]
MKITTNFVHDFPDPNFDPSSDFNWEHPEGKSTVVKAESLLLEFVQAATDLEFCRTSDPCGFIVREPLERIAPAPIILLKNCSQTISLPDLSEGGMYLLSHSGFGCLYFPNTPVNACSLKLTYPTSSTTKLKISSSKSFKGFLGTDGCDGYSLEFDTDGLGNGANTNYCTANPLPDVSFTGELTVILKGSSTNDRKKMGFDFLIEVA